MTLLDPPCARLPFGQRKTAVAAVFVQYPVYRSSLGEGDDLKFRSTVCHERPSSKNVSPPSAEEQGDVSPCTPSCAVVPTPVCYAV